MKKCPFAPLLLLLCLLVQLLAPAAGAVEYLPVVRVSNLSAAVRELKERGVWIYAADMEGENWCQVDYTGPMALVVGSEGRGVSRLMKENSDYIVAMPMRGKVNSLNASVAAGILMYEAARQRMGIPAVLKSAGPAETKRKKEAIR